MNTKENKCIERFESFPLTALADDIRWKRNARVSFNAELMCVCVCAGGENIFCGISKILSRLDEMI